MNSDQLEKNHDFVKAKYDKLYNLYPNKYILVHKQQVVTSYDTYETAVEEGISNYGIDGEFLIHYMSENETVNFLSLADL